MISRQDVEVDGGFMMNGSIRTCQKWCILFNGERKNVLVEESNGQSSVVTKGTKTKIEQKFKKTCMAAFNFIVILECE